MGDMADYVNDPGSGYESPFDTTDVVGGTPGEPQLPGWGGSLGGKRELEATEVVYVIYTNDYIDGELIRGIFFQKEEADKLVNELNKKYSKWIRLHIKEVPCNKNIHMSLR